MSHAYVGARAEPRGRTGVVSNLVAFRGTGSTFDPEITVGFSVVPMEGSTAGTENRYEESPKSCPIGADLRLVEAVNTIYAGPSKQL